MRSWSIAVGRIFGAELRIHLSFAFLLLFVWMTEASLPHASLARGLAMVVLVVISVLAHEIGHGLAALHEDLPARSIILLPIGGVTMMHEAARHKFDPRSELRHALSGPAVNLLLALLCGSIVLAILPQAALDKPPYMFSGNLPRSFFWMNVFLAAFNLLPAYPADGGRVVRALLAQRMDPVLATRRAITTGQVFATLLILAGIWNTWSMLAGFFLFLGAQLEDRSAIFQSVLEQVRLEEVMLTDFSTLSPADTLEDALQKAVHTLQDDFPVVRGSDMVGVISKQKILESLRAQGNGYVQAVMNRVFAVAQRSESLGSAFRKLTALGQTIIPVVDNEHLVGIVTLQNLMHSMSLLAESKKLRRQDEA
jgi:Zn-dependent protease/predicted transcriptional regulator